ncbi:ATP-dependent DNA helicase RecG [Rhodococcoides corynebacterioides]|uniref:ATP-dependent DNA helicase RecG n=1 Tax=Rhodococcoides corynebacterioides TaxID=53972 RepID=UPI001C9AF394|nr:ATP-dependent DNA helicase RecG [Rhodococcus corynebacterioides]MBY6350151.1 ATP-dependent DNA helicase RecG [Rhodococcus corynebacterioides]
MTHFDDRLDTVLEVGVARALEESFELITVGDLLRYVPSRYVSQGSSLGSTDPYEGDHVTVVGRVDKCELFPHRGKRGISVLEVTLDCDGQHVKATFFNGSRVKHAIKKDQRVMFSGTVKYWRSNWSLNHPRYLVLDDDESDLVSRGDASAGPRRGVGQAMDAAIRALPFLPVYPAAAGIESWDILWCTRTVLEDLDAVEDPLPDVVRAQEGLAPLDHALRAVHFPASRNDAEAARHRLRFDEAAAVQLVLATRRQSAAARPAPACPPRRDGLAAAFDDVLPFDLTDGQRIVAEEIGTDLSIPHPMNRLLQGEVGSGKTIVALRAMLQVVDAGYQCALLAPTEVLATQHHRSITAQLGALATAGELGAPEHATRVVLLTGSMSTAARRAALLAVVSGDAGIVIGTHALIQESVSFFDLGMVVVDEQHRFGVEQRDMLRAKARGDSSPHLLVMTATPIPRTIAMTTLGDLDTSTLRELPRGRSPIATSVVPARAHPGWVARAWARITEEVAAGRQAYVVCSRIGEDEDTPPSRRAKKTSRRSGSDRGKDEAEAEDGNAPTTAAALDVFEALRSGPLSGVRVGLLHGRLPADEKDAVMTAFDRGEIDVLVCTTVVEVGVDVPNATTMVVMDADRFGVSQLHQLRGRVGRGGHPGLCILVTDVSPSSPSLNRLEAVAGTTDGFELALLDLRQRREGNVLGADQSGTRTNLRLLSVLDHLDIIMAAREFAQRVVAEDPGLARHPGLAGMMRSAWDATRVDFLDKA